jgi:hypothetical protein
MTVLLAISAVLGAMAALQAAEPAIRWLLTCRAMVRCYHRPEASATLSAVRSACADITAALEVKAAADVARIHAAAMVDSEWNRMADAAATRNVLSGLAAALVPVDVISPFTLPETFTPHMGTLPAPYIPAWETIREYALVDVLDVNGATQLDLFGGAACSA